MIFNVVGGGGKLPTPEEIGALSMELLWENASYTSAFANQHVALDLTEYDFLDVVFRISTTIGYDVVVRVIKGATTNCIGENNAGKIITRIAATDNEKITINGGYVYNSYGSYTSDDNYMIPKKIYGIKGVSA